MFHQTEAKAQGWRAMAIFDDGRGEALLLVGRSSTAIRNGYVESFNDLLDEEEREHIQAISLQRWQGAPDAGNWLHQANLKVPATKLVRVAA